MHLQSSSILVTFITLDSSLIKEVHTHPNIMHMVLPSIQNLPGQTTISS